MNTKKLIILLVAFAFCLPITHVYALEQGNVTLNGVGNLLSGFVQFVIELFSGIIFGIADFFANLFGLFLLVI